ncbi:PQQ-dependent sugar dehydrogenase [Sphingobium algorifonticola]|uniref:Sorbosone dehydrogenase family protein n=1 Tax=Sphingobium algorifonticola TaxID=2008318 RepID=A0A437J567_9SPHN|nr:sorbosone dehydrogenase family protein [Sphingobium algorifonticola]RVT39887.1 sorbosone dehydrogenase family protein [Sphingobium algorifonticola]
MKKYLLLALVLVAAAVGGFLYMAQGDTARLAPGQDVGREPLITTARREIVPTVNIADVVGWKAGEAPQPAQGLKVARFAEGLEHPRTILQLPNGDVLVAETNSPPRKISGIKDRIMGFFFAKAGAGGASPNRITLLRDADGDGRAEVKTPLLTGLHSPYGMALVGNTLYIADTDKLLAFPYNTGDTKITAAPRKIMNLPAQGPNHHWTKGLLASPDGQLLYVSVGSNSNIGENGLDLEANRANILEVNLTKGDYRIFASGLRNPVGMGWEPKTGQLWTVVNERDMLGSDLVPDYLTRVEFGGFYGWPWNYWGGYEDRRVQPERPELREYTHRPDYALGNHVAPLGLSFAQTGLGAPFTNGAFVGLHGSWNRKPAAGYKVIFVPFGADGRPNGKPIDVLSAFLNAQGDARGRPVDVTADTKGALLVTDDVGGKVWRVSR